MNQTDSLYAELKSQLRGYRLTYAMVAEALELSEASVKRLFAEQTLSLQRMEAICDLMGLSLAQLMRLAEQRRSTVDELSEEQEKRLIRNPHLLVTSICVTNRLSFEEILKRYRLEELELVQLMAELDRLDIIEMLPFNRYRLKVSRNFRWRRNGPIQRFFVDSVLKEFYSPSSDTYTHHRFSWGFLTSDQIQTMKVKLDEMVTEFVNQSDGAGEDKLGTMMVLSMRGHWEPSLFRDLRA